MVVDRASSENWPKVNVFFLRCFIAILTSESGADGRSGSSDHRRLGSQQNIIYTPTKLYGAFLKFTSCSLFLAMPLNYHGCEVSPRLRRCLTWWQTLNLLERSGVFIFSCMLSRYVSSKCCQRECKLVSSWCLSYDELGKSCGWHIIYWAAHLFLLLIELCVKVRTHEINHVHYSQAPLMQQEYM